MFGDGSDLRKERLMGTLSKTVCFDCGVSVKLAGGTSNLQTHIRRHHPLKQAVRSKSVVQAEASTSQSTVMQVPSTSNVKTVSAENSKQTTIMAAFGALPSPINSSCFFLLKIHTRQRKTMSSKVEESTPSAILVCRMLILLKERNSNQCVMRLMIAYFSSTLVCLVSFKQGRFEA